MHAEHIITVTSCGRNLLPLPPQEHRVEIDARTGAFNAFESFGSQLLTHRHFAGAEVQEKLAAHKRDRKAIEK